MERPPIQTQQGRWGSRPQAGGNMYAMIGVEAKGSSNLVIGCCMIVGKRLCVLFDYGAKHSFVSESCVRVGFVSV